MSKLPISHVKPDFQYLYEELAKKLEEKRTWVDLLPTNVGSTLLDMFAGTTTVNQFYIENSLREAFTATAVRDSSIFSIARMLGVSISRKTSASCTARLTNESYESVFISPYTEFKVGGRKFFNRTQIVVPSQSFFDTNLYEGSVHEKVFDLDTVGNLQFKEFLIGEQNFSVSNEDLLVYTENKNSGVLVEWAHTEKAMFEHSSDSKVHFQATTGSGDVSIFFGDGTYGAELPKDNLLKILYVKTLGASENVGNSGLEVKLLSHTAIKGATISPIISGSDQKPSLYYKLFAGKMHRTKTKAISGSDYRAILMDYAGVADAIVYGQKDIAPNDNAWMNVLRLCILPENSDTLGGSNPNPKSAAWSAVLSFLANKKHEAIEIQTWNPDKIYVNVKVKVAVFPFVDVQEMKLLIMEQILKLFEKKPGILGRKLSISDITTACKLEGVDYIKVISPTEEIKPENKLYYTVLDGLPVVDMVYSERPTAY